MRLQCFQLNQKNGSDCTCAAETFRVKKEYQPELGLRGDGVLGGKRTLETGHIHTRHTDTMRTRSLGAPSARPTGEAPPRKMHILLTSSGK